MITLSIGSLYSSVSTAERFLTINSRGDAFWFLVILSCTITIIRGFVATLKLKALNKKINKNTY